MKIKYPYIYVDTVLSKPFSVIIAGLMLGEQVKQVPLPDWFYDLDLSQQQEATSMLINSFQKDYKKSYNKIFGGITGYRLVISSDMSFEFDCLGKIVAQSNSCPIPPLIELEIVDEYFPEDDSRQSDPRHEPGSQLESAVTENMNNIVKH